MYTSARLSAAHYQWYHIIMSRLFFLLAAVLLIGPVIEIYSVQAAPTLQVEVDHAIMFNRHHGREETSLYGSRGVLLHGGMRRYRVGTSPSYHGYTVYVPCEEHLTKSSLYHLAASAPSIAAKGLVVELCSEDAANEEALSYFFSVHQSPLPVYFIARGKASQELDKLLTAAELHPMTERVELSIAKTLRLSEPVANLTLPSSTIEGRFVHKPSQLRKMVSSSVAAPPQVLVTAHFDTLGVAPASRTNAGVSGAVTAMELWRRLTAIPNSHADSADPYSVTVLLGSTARFNYAGTTSWVAEHTDAELDAFKVVLSLDELLPPREAAQNAAELYLHVPDALLKRPVGKQFVEVVEAAAKDLDISLQVVAAKTNYRHYDLRFEHEVFATRQMAAMTLSAHRHHQLDQIFRDFRREPLTTAEVATLAKRADLVEAIVHLWTSSAPFAGAEVRSWPGSSSYMLGMLQYASEMHRSPVAHHGTDLRQYAVTVEHQMGTQAVAAQRAANTSAVVSVTHLRLRMPGITLLGPYEETMSVFAAKSYLFEGAVMLASLVALLGFLHVELGLKVLVDLFMD